MPCQRSIRTRFPGLTPSEPRRRATEAQSKSGGRRGRARRGLHGTRSASRLAGLVDPDRLRRAGDVPVPRRARLRRTVVAPSRRSRGRRPWAGSRRAGPACDRPSRRGGSTGAWSSPWWRSAPACCGSCRPAARASVSSCSGPWPSPAPVPRWSGGRPTRAQQKQWRAEAGGRVVARPVRRPRRLAGAGPRHRRARPGRRRVRPGDRAAGPDPAAARGHGHDHACARRAGGRPGARGCTARGPH